MGGFGGTPDPKLEGQAGDLAFLTVELRVCFLIGWHQQFLAPA